MATPQLLDDIISVLLLLAPSAAMLSLVLAGVSLRREGTVLCHWRRLHQMDVLGGDLFDPRTAAELVPFVWSGCTSSIGRNCHRVVIKYSGRRDAVRHELRCGTTRTHSCRVLRATRCPRRRIRSESTVIDSGCNVLAGHADYLQSARRATTPDPNMPRSMCWTVFGTTWSGPSCPSLQSSPWWARS